MKLPLILLDNLAVGSEKRWQLQFVDPGRKYIEGVWRRTQEEENARFSGWKGPADARRKIVHYIDLFDLQKSTEGNRLILTEPYLWVHYTFPKKEIAEFLGKIERSFKGWIKKSEDHYIRGDIECLIDVEKNQLDPMFFPDDYGYLSITIQNIGKTLTPDKKREPWDVLKTGIRKIPGKGNPERTENLKEILPFFPAHLELGCGPSIEAGVPPLHYLHSVFYISNVETNKFILDLKADKLIPDILENPEEFYKRSSLPYQKALAAPITKFYRLIQSMHDRGMIFDPVITNNFDGFPSLIGMKEKYTRRYSESEIVPDIDFDPKARSLIVVGSHADRRRVQQAARRKGLKVIFVDPEGYGDKRISYPLESPQDEDVVINMTAQKFAEKITELLKLK